MKHLARKKIIWGIHMLKHMFLLVVIIGFVLPAVAAPPLPREPMPKPTLPGTFQGVPKPSIHIGTRPKFNPSNIGALPDLKIVRVTSRINSRVAGICRAGRKDRPGSSIPVLNFDLVVKNVGRGTAYMDRYGVILSAQTMDFRERVFDTNKRYQGGTGGPGHFQGPHGPQPWLLVRMGQIAPGATFTAHAGLGIGRTNSRFTIARMNELAGQTHRFRIKLTSYGSPGLKESNTRNNTYIVRYTFPRNFCKKNEARVHGGVTQPVAALPDFLITKLTPPNSFSCSAQGGRIAMGFFHGKIQIKNRGGNPTYTAAEATTHSNLTLARLIRVPGTRLRFRLTGGIKYRDMPKAGQTIRRSFAIGLWDDSKTNGQASAADLSKAMQWLRGRTVSLPIQLNGLRRSDLVGKPMLEGNTRNNTSILRVTFSNRLCQNLDTQSGSTPVPIHPTSSHITGFQFSGGKACVSPRGVFVVKGSAFGNSADGRTIKLGGNGLSVNLAIKSWNNRTIRVQLSRTARLQYHKNYWVRILAPAVAGSARTLSNLKLGVALCSPSVHVGGAGSSGSPGEGSEYVMLESSVSDITLVATAVPLPPGRRPGRLQHGYDVKITAKVAVKNTGRVPSLARPMTISLHQNVRSRDLYHSGMISVRRVAGDSNSHLSINIPALSMGRSYSKVITFAHLPHRLWDGDDYTRGGMFGTSQSHVHYAILSGYSCKQTIDLGRHGTLHPAGANVTISTSMPKTGNVDPTPMVVMSDEITSRGGGWFGRILGDPNYEIHCKTLY